MNILDDDNVETADELDFDNVDDADDEVPVQ